MPEPGADKDHRQDPRPVETFFATCAPGVEPTLHAEVRALRLAKSESQVGGVRFEGTLRDAWRANLHLRTAIRVLWRLERFRAATEDELYAGVGEIDWSRHLLPDGALSISAQTKDSTLDHSMFIAQKTKDAIVDQFRARHGVRPSVDREDPDLAIHVHLWRNRCTVSIDTSGDSLHKRGWRRFQGRAPLAETLAAAMVLESEWDRRSPLVDPFCGSGTVLIEAALIAANAPAGMFRDEFAFERLPDHDDDAWEEMRDEAIAAVRPPPKLILRGRDIDPAAVKGARENLAAAGLDNLIEVDVGDALELDFKRGWNATIVTNPPWGERVGERDRLTPLYRDLGDLLRERCGGYRVALLCGHRPLAQALGFPSADRRRVFNGAIECEVSRFTVPRR